MLIIKINDGRTYLFQWDRGVKFNLLCGSDTVTEMHFVTPNGIIRREVEGNTVNVPDAALQTAGTLTMYAFLRDASCAITRREVHMQVLARPKPADYIDPAGEEDYIDVIVDRLKKLPEVKGDKGDPGAPGKDGSDAEVTAENVEAALGYKPVKDVQIAGTSILADGVAGVKLFETLGYNAYGLYIKDTIDNNIRDRANGYPITGVKLDYAVKAAMCDGKGAAWTSAEQQAARHRMGIDKPYELIEEIDIDEENVSVVERNVDVTRMYLMIIGESGHTGTCSISTAFNSGHSFTAYWNLANVAAQYELIVENGIANGFYKFSNSSISSTPSINGISLNAMKTIFSATSKPSKISKLTIAGGIPNGSKFILYGVRA